MAAPPPLPEPVRSDKQLSVGGQRFPAVYREARRPAPLPPGLDLSELGGLAATAHGFIATFHPRVYDAAPDIVCEQDVAVTLRDGARIYCDIFRPKDSIPVPVIVSWSAYGKRPGDAMSRWVIPGVPPGTVSTMAKFESADPAYWCRIGYAVANVDTRGVGHSDGDIELFGPNDAQDGYDFIEWVAAQPWCNGRVGMAGNSFVAMTQLRIAAQQPPHLSAIAPWEASSDMYRDLLLEGGIPALTFNEFIVSSLSGQGRVDDLVANALRYPLMHPYWQSKIPDFTKITVPAYLAVGWSHIHLRGTMNAWRRIASRDKWLRCYREHEWPVFYARESVADLTAFFDRYLRDVHNGWELTPRVRLDVMDAGDADYQTSRAEAGFPIERTEYRRLYLDTTVQTLVEDPPTTSAAASYDPATEALVFDLQLPDEVELSGYMMLRLWVEAVGHDDMDLFVTVKKADADGSFVPWTILGQPHPGAWGKMRVSHRALDAALSSDFNPVQSHVAQEKLAPGQVVPVDIEIVPSSRVWHRGERLRLEVAGRYLRGEWFEPLSWETDNRGRHVVHAGGDHDSYLQIPVIPPRRSVGGYLAR
ncbi:MAG: CocE/NonD family hydrolase [Dermatophilaceae bacterium]